MAHERPNILWLMTDEQRCDSMGCYGSPWAKTPHLDGLAERGVLFRTAITPAPVCLPARVAFMTGQYPNRTGLWWNDGHHGVQLNHLTDVFHAAGYRSASFGKQHYGVTNQAFQHETHRTYSEHLGALQNLTPEEAAERDVVQYPPEPYPWIFAGRFPAPADETAEALSITDAIDWLDDHLDNHADQPFLLRVSFNAPHTPVSPPEPFDRIIDESRIDLPPEADKAPDGQADWITHSLAKAADASRLNDEQCRKMRRHYYGQVAFVDEQFGRIIDAIEQRSLADNTIIAYVSDHGTHLCDYGLVQKQTFYEPVVNVPFFIAGPGIASGKRIDTPVEALSLLPTLIELAGLTVPAHADGVSLAETLRSGDEPAAQPVFSEFTLGSFNMRPNDRLVMVRDGDWKYSACLDPEFSDETLHNTAADPYERHNLAGDPAHRDTQKRMKDLLLDHVADAVALHGVAQ